MARWSPPVLPHVDGESSSLGHDAVALCMLVACVAATVGLASSVCSACGRRPKAVSHEPDGSAESKSKSGGGGGTVSGSVSGGVGCGGGRGEHGSKGDKAEEVVMLSPELATHGPIEPTALPTSTSSRRKLSMSLSKNLINIPDKLKLSRRERRDIKDAPEDALWKKAIILGEKCRIPGERDGEAGGDDADIDEMAAGTFRRSSYSRPVSRSNSFAVHQPTTPPPPPPAAPADLPPPAAQPSPSLI